MRSLLRQHRDVSLADAVHRSGKRLTLQRQLVLDAVERAKHHVTAEGIARRVRAKYPGIGPSTVYRNLQALEELGYVIHTHLDDRVTRWHRADTHPHAHPVCRPCGGHTDERTQVLLPIAPRIHPH